MFVGAGSRFVTMRSVILSLVCFLAAVGSAVCKTSIVPLAAFSVVHVDVPVNVLIRPSGGSSEYRMVAEADESFTRALQTDVRNGVLLVSMRSSYQTDNQIKLVFEIPADALRRVEKMGTSSLVVGPSFAPNSFEVLNKGTGLVWVVQMRCNRVTVNSEDAGVVSLGGLIQEVVATADGSSRVYMEDIQKYADITALDATQVYVQGPSRLKVNGKTSPAASIRANGPGTCTTTRLNSRFFSFPRRCSSFSARRVPTFNPTWTCSSVGAISQNGSPVTAERSVSAPGGRITGSVTTSGNAFASTTGSVTTRGGTFSSSLFSRSSSRRGLLGSGCGEEKILSYTGNR